MPAASALSPVTSCANGQKENRLARFSGARSRGGSLARIPPLAPEEMDHGSRFCTESDFDSGFPRGYTAGARRATDEAALALA